MASARSMAEASRAERRRMRADGMGGADSRPSMGRARCRAHGRRAMAGMGAGPQGRTVRPRRESGAHGGAVRTRRHGAESRSVGTRRRKGPVVGPVMVARGRRHPERREYGDDEGGGAIACPNGYAAGIDPRGGDCDRAADGWPAVVVGAAGEGGAEQGCAEQRGEALHGRTPCVWKEGRRELPAFLHLN